MGWLHCPDLRHKIAHYSLASRREGSVHPILAALMPRMRTETYSGEIKEISRAIARRDGAQHEAAVGGEGPVKGSSRAPRGKPGPGRAPKSHR